MIVPSPSLALTNSLCILGKPYTGDENLPVLSKRSFAQQADDQLEPKRCQALPGMQFPRRAPLDPLPTSDMQNRRFRVSLSTVTESALHHSLVTPSSVPDPRVSLPGEFVSSGYCGMQRSGASSTPVCSWPPPIPAPCLSGGSSHSSLTGQLASHCAPPHSSDESSRASSTESTLTWDAFQSEPTTTMTKPLRTTEWKPENLHQPIRARTCSMPSVRRPPGELWRSDSKSSAAATYESVDAADSLTCSAPPGIPPRRSELRRRGSETDLSSAGSISLSLALGSQPLRASEHAKAVSPIGAERNRAVSMTAQLSDPLQSPYCFSQPSPRLRTKWKNDTASLEKAQAVAGNTTASKEDLERLLRNAVRNRHAPRIISPLSPLRSSSATFDLSTDLEYQLRMPSPSNNLSPRYSKSLLRRARTACDIHQPHDLDITCMHCQECKRDTVGKKLLAFRYRQQHVQRPKLYHAGTFNMSPLRGTNVTAAATTDDDRMALASRIRGAFAYEMDDEEKSLWEEVAAVTGAGPLPRALRTGAPCATAATHRDLRGVSDDGNDDLVGTTRYNGGGDRAEIDMVQDEGGLLANESVTLFRDVTVY